MRTIRLTSGRRLGGPLFLLLCGASVLIGCGPSIGGDKSRDGTLPQPAPPKWVPFNAPLAKVDLPSFIVGEQKELSSGCWLAGQATDVGSGDMTWSTEQQQEFAANLQANFKKYLVEAGFDAS